MHERPLVSVIIPTYNRLLELCECVESLARQTYQHMEILIVNDNGEPISTIQRLYPELDIHIIDHLENRKHVHARNSALRIAKGDYVLLCDDDDMLLPMHLETMLREIEGVDLVYSDVEIVSYVYERTRRVPSVRRLFAYNSSYEQMRSFSTFVASGCLYRRKIHDTIGLFDPDVLNYWDWDFYLRVAKKFSCKRVPIASVLYAFSDEGEHASAQLNTRRQQYLDKLCEKHGLGQLPQKNFFLLLDEPEVASRAASTKSVWDGVLPKSRYEHARKKYSLF